MSEEKSQDWTASPRKKRSEKGDIYSKNNSHRNLNRIQQTVLQIIPAVVSRIQVLEKRSCVGSTIKTKLQWGEEMPSLQKGKDRV